MRIKKTDPRILKLIEKETERQKTSLEMIPSENHTSPAVREALGSLLTDKYAEGYPGKRYYAGLEFYDKIEDLCRERAKKLFKVSHANVQPYSGSPANQAVYFALCQPGDTIMGMSLPHGGHLTHGWKASMTSSFYKTLAYHVKEDGYIDLEEVKKLAKKHNLPLIEVLARLTLKEGLSVIKDEDRRI